MQGPIDLRGKETLKTLRHRESHLLCSNLDRLVDPCLLHASILHPAHGCTRIFVELCAWYWVRVMPRVFKVLNMHGQAVLVSGFMYNCSSFFVRLSTGEGREARAEDL